MVCKKFRFNNWGNEKPEGGSGAAQGAWRAQAALLGVFGAF